MELESICFEGISGAGKTTQLNKMHSKLKKLNLNPEIILEENQFEPLRTVIYNWKKEGFPAFDINRITEFARAKYLVQTKYLFPAINSKKIVLMDRGVFTAAVYQAGKISIEEILSINKRENVYFPHKTIVFLCSAETALSRIKTRRIEENRKVNQYDCLEDLNKRIKNYNQLAEMTSSLEMINTEKNVDSVFDEVCRRLKI